MIRDPLTVFLKDFAEDDALVFEWETETGECSKSCKGVFDNSFVDANIGETVMDTTAPRLTCLYEDVKGVPREAMVTVRGVAYSVVQTQPDGTGLAIVHLAHEP